MKDSDRILLDGLRATTASDVPADHWEMVEKAVEEAGDIRLIDGYAATIVLGAIEKGRFANRSEAGRYAANMRWRGSVPQGGRAANEARMADNARRGKGSGNPARGGKTVASSDEQKRLTRIFMRWMDDDGPQTSAQDLQAMIDAKILKPEQLNNYDRALLGLPPQAKRMPLDSKQTGAEPAGAKEPFLDLTDVDPQGKLEDKSNEDRRDKPRAPIKEMNLSDIASEIRRDLKAQGKKVPPAAAPYLDALGSMDKISDAYFADSGSSVVAYLLGNLSSYKGETARAIKTELNRRLKEEGANIDRRQAAQDTWARG